MKQIRLALWAVVGLCVVRASFATDPASPAPSPTILAQWPGTDTPLLRGQSRRVDAGDRAGALENFGPGAKLDQPGGAWFKNRPDLTPAGAFTLDVRICPKPEFFDQDSAYLIDKKYYPYASTQTTAHCDYLLQIRKTGSSTSLTAVLGYGTDSEIYTSDSFALPTQVWTRVAFTYDGKGRGSFYLNGICIGSQCAAGRGPVVAGPHPLVIGDRVGGNFGSFIGFIGEAAVRNGIAPELQGSLLATWGDGRSLFRRMEADARLTLKLSNTRDEVLTGIHATVTLPEGAPMDVAVADLSPWEQRTLTLPIRTDYRPDSYPVSVELRASSATTNLSIQADGTFTIVPRPAPNRMPVVLWAGGDPDEIRKIGFTHYLLPGPDYQRIWDAGRPVEADSPKVIPERIRQLDHDLEIGLDGLANLSPGRWISTSAPEPAHTSLMRMDREKKPRARANVCCRMPEAQRYAEDVGASVALTYGAHPALAGALIHTEIRDGTEICYHDLDRDAYRTASGHEYPDGVTSKNGVSVATRKAAVALNGIVPDNQPILSFLRWFWSEGDGWNHLHSLVNRGFHSAPRNDLWTFFDPAVRAPPVWGSGGHVDVISQWTYSYPDPLRVGLATDELFAMAAGRPGQRVMTMTQIIWYRSQTTGEPPAREEERAEWERQTPDAEFITSSPDHLSESFWMMISRPVRGIMFHGWDSLIGAKSSRKGRLTHPGTAPVLSRLIHTVTEPLGPMLLDLEDPPADVAMLESAASVFFGAQGTWGWGHGWSADLYQALMWARLQPKIVYEESLLRDGLEGIRVLVLPDCPVLPRSVADRILAFQKQGGIVVGDETLALAIQPDILVRKLDGKNSPDRTKAALLSLAEQLRGELAPAYDWPADSSDPEVLVRRRRAGQADYVFAINDRRKFGTYIGQYRRVMEDGLPSEARLSLRRADGVVYDLLRHAKVTARANDGSLSWPVSLGPGEGRLYLVAPQTIARTEVLIASRKPTGPDVSLTIRVLAEDGSPIDAAIPVRIEILDPEGKSAEFSGAYSARGGMLKLPLTLASNDTRGKWTVRVRDLASDTQAEASFEYR